MYLNFLLLTENRIQSPVPLLPRRRSIVADSFQQCRPDTREFLKRIWYRFSRLCRAWKYSKLSQQTYLVMKPPRALITDQLHSHMAQYWKDFQTLGHSSSTDQLEVENSHVYNGIYTGEADVSSVVTMCTKSIRKPYPIEKP